MKSKSKFGNDGSISSRKIQRISTKELALEVEKLFLHRSTMPILKRGKVNNTPRLLSQKKDSTPLNCIQIFKNSKIVTPLVSDNVESKTPLKSKCYFPTNSPSSLISNLRKVDDRVINYKKAHARLVSITHQYMTNNSPPKSNDKMIGPFFE